MAQKTFTLENINEVEPVPLSPAELVGLSEKDQNTKIMLNKTNYIQEARKAYFSAYEKEFNRVEAIPATLSAQIKLSEGDIADKKMQLATPKAEAAGVEALNKFINSHQRVFDQKNNFEQKAQPKPGAVPTLQESMALYDKQSKHTGKLSQQGMFATAKTGTAPPLEKPAAKQAPSLDEPPPMLSQRKR
jgi:hypothetical protein